MKQTQNSLPEWYWSHGLHDANIIVATKKQSNWNPNDNCLILKISCDGALSVADITEIRFYNFKFKSGFFDINLLNGGWWLSDEILKKGDHYLLDLKFDTAECKTKHLEMAFQRAEVIRE
ncbi:MAG: hypothetical protein ACI4IJ_10125 [Acutalibacteraceae bacterium]